MQQTYIFHLTIFRWDLTEIFQGVESPLDRSEDDFDPGAKYHIIADVEYIQILCELHHSVPIPQNTVHRSEAVRSTEAELETPARMRYLQQQRSWKLVEVSSCVLEAVQIANTGTCIRIHGAIYYCRVDRCWSWVLPSPGKTRWRRSRAKGIWTLPGSWNTSNR